MHAAGCAAMSTAFTLPDVLLLHRRRLAPNSLTFDAVSAVRSVELQCDVNDSVLAFLL